MNSRFEVEGVPSVSGAAPVMAGQKSVSAPLEYRAVSEEQLMEAELGPLERRRGERRMRFDELAASLATDQLSREQALEKARQEGFEQGRAEGQSRARKEMDAQCERASSDERDRVMDALERFQLERERYFDEVENHVVKFALAIARQVLHREVKIDPLLLSAAVRVALEKMTDRSEVTLRSAIADVQAWEMHFMRLEAEHRPRVVGEANLHRGDCIIESSVGIVDLGVAAQMEEIEKGFFDLLQTRPREVGAMVAA